MPVTVKVLESGVGYIRVNTFADDAVLMTHAWDWAISRLNDLGVSGLIVDVRGNGGGSGFLATYMAGSFYDDEFPLSEVYFEDGGNVWLEGQGVQPTVDVPVTVASLTPDHDVVLDAAVEALLDA